MQEIPKLVPIPKKNSPRKKIVVMKDEDEDEKGENFGKFGWTGVIIIQQAVKGVKPQRK